MADLDTPRPTVSQVMAAHAAAQIRAAQDADLARNSDVIAPPKPEGVHCVSFTVSWATAAMCIGFKKPAAG